MPCDGTSPYATARYDRGLPSLTTKRAHPRCARTHAARAPTLRRRFLVPICIGAALRLLRLLLRIWRTGATVLEILLSSQFVHVSSLIHKIVIENELLMTQETWMYQMYSYIGDGIG